MKIYTILPRGFGANAYAITTDNQTAIVIDPAAPRVLDELKKYNLIPVCVLLTHCHFDHVGGVAALQGEGAKVYCLDEELPLVGTKADMAAAFGASVPHYEVDKTLTDNEQVTLCGVQVKALHTPGHTKGSCCYLFTAKDGGRYLFTGDTLFCDSVGRCDLITGDSEQLNDSLKRLLEIFKEDIPVLAGHGEPTTMDRERKHNPYLKNL